MKQNVPKTTNVLSPNLLVAPKYTSRQESTVILTGNCGFSNYAASCCKIKNEVAICDLKCWLIS